MQAQPRGFFGIGMEGPSKPMNFGNLARSAHGFGASFVFTVAPVAEIGAPASDTTGSFEHLPWYSYESVAALRLPDNARLVGVDLTDDAIDLPSFRHPTCAAYLLGPENGSLSPAALAACTHVIRIPTRFCLNVATAGAVIMYDRMVSLGRFAERPVRVGGPTAPLPEAVHGQRKYSAGTLQPGRKGRNRQTVVGERYRGGREED